MRVRRVRQQIQLELAAPLLVCLGQFTGCCRCAGNLQLLHAGEHQITKATSRTVISAHMPAQAGINQRMRHDLSLHGAGFHRVIAQAQRLTLMNGARDHGQNVQRRLVEPGGYGVRQRINGRRRLTRAKAASQGRQHAVHRMLKQRLKVWLVAVALLLVNHVVRGQFFVERHIAGACCCGDFKTLKHMLARHLAVEPDAKFNIGQALPLRSREIVDRKHRTHSINQIILSLLYQSNQIDAILKATKMIS